MSGIFKSSILVALAGCYASAALSEEAAAPAAPQSLIEAVQAGKPLTSFRLRYEDIDQDGKTEDAGALTLRSLIGWQTAPYHDFSIAAQLINVGVFDDDYDNRDKWRPEPGKGNYPIVVDPDDTDINQLFVEWTGLKGTKVRLGRQSVKLDNVRFVGNVEFRQVMQVFDGIALENKGLLPDTSIYLAHFERVKQVSTKLQDANIGIANIRYAFTPGESLTAYAYLVDWNGTARPINPNVNANANHEGTSSKTFGLRLDGARKLNDDWKLLYTAEYAKQDDYKDGIDQGVGEIDAHYLRLGAGAQFGSWYLRADREDLASNDGKSAFQTPLGTNHLFQGWADVFLTTPNAGIEDTFLSAGGKLFDVSLMAEYHWINSDEGFASSGGKQGDSYGEELDLSAAYAWKKWLGKVEYASYREDDALTGNGANARKRDKEMFWLTVMYTF